MAIIHSISTTAEFDTLAREHHISWTEASRIGMSILLAERGLREYDNKLNLFRKMTLFRQQAENALQKLAELEQKEQTEKTPIKQEITETEILDNWRKDKENEKKVEAIHNEN